MVEANPSGATASSGAADSTSNGPSNQGRGLIIHSNNFIHMNEGNIKTFYKISSCIGRGAYGEVRKCLSKETNALRAVKIINKKYLEEEEKQKLLSEISILKQMDHPNILKLYEFFQDPKRYFLVTELCNGGELFERIAQEQYFSEQDAANIIKQVLSAINYCHSRNIVHRDLKPENLLLDRSGDQTRVTIIDFGTAGAFEPGVKMTQKYGTPYYIAPEVLKRNYDQKCDLWSCGVILYILLCGYPPFNGQTDKKIIEAVLVGEYTLDEPEWQGVSAEAKNLVASLLKTNPEMRISALDALNHPWIQANANIDRVTAEVATRTLRNLQAFRGHQQIKQATMAFIASHLTNKEEKKDLEKIFKLMDKDGNGTLDKQEVMQGYEEHFGIQMTDEQVDQMFEAVDIDGNGSIDYTEFVMATMNERDLISQQKLKAAFRLFDKDGSGSISQDELKKALGIQDQDEILSKLLEEIDENNDGEIQFEEFCNMMQRLTI